VSYYVSKDTPVFSAFTDASKAFDRTNHNLLFAKLIQRNVPKAVAAARHTPNWGHHTVTGGPKFSPVTT